MELEKLARNLAGVPHTDRLRGRRLYEHIRATGAADVLEIGTAHGAGTAYIAAALEGGHVVSVDHDQAGYTDPTAQEVLSRLGLDGRVTLVKVEDSSYTWWLKQEVERRSDADGNCEPAFDFIFVDGAHNWTIDGLTVILAEKLLRPGGWLLLDDLEWTYASYDATVGAVPSDKMYALSTAERGEPHLRAVFDLLVKQHPAFGEFKEDDDIGWGWAKKTNGPRRLTLDTARTPSWFVVTAIRRLRARLRR
jgi:predicted O-methyltransferase YrrM